MCARKKFAITGPNGGAHIDFIMLLVKFVFVHKNPFCSQSQEFNKYSFFEDGLICIRLFGIIDGISSDLNCFV